MSGFGGSVKLQGESEYRKALKSIQQGLREVSSDMKLMSAQFASSDKATDKLSAKSVDLAKKLEVQKKALVELKSSYNSMAAEYDKQVNKTNELERTLDAEKSKLETLKNTLGTTSKEYLEQANVVDKLEKELEESEKAQDGMATSLSKMRTQINNAETNIVKADNALDKYEKELDEATKDEKELGNSAETMGNEVKNASDKTSSASKGFTVMRGALANLASQGIQVVISAVKDLAKSTINASIDFEKGMSKVASISGATGKDLDKLKKKAKQMGASTQFTAGQSAEAFQYMAMAGWKTRDMLKGIDGVMNLAAASGEDLATTSDIVTDALTAFKLKAKDASHFSDVLAVASSNANTNVGMMGETFKYVAPVAGSLGYKVEDVAQAIGLMANAGIKSSQAGTSLRSIITRLSTDAGASSKSLGALGTLTKKLGVEFYDAQGKVRPLNDIINESRTAWKNLSKEEQSNYAKKIAGQNAISGWSALMNASSKDVDKLSEALAKADGTSKKMADTMLNNLGGDLTKLSSAFEGFQLSVSEGASESLRGLVQEVTNGVIPALSDLVKGTDGASEKLAKSISNILNRLLTSISNSLPEVIKFGTTLIVDLAKGVVEGLPQAIKTLTESLKVLVNELVKGVSDLLESANVGEIVDSTVDLFLSMADALPIVIEKLLPHLATFVIKLGAALIKNSPRFYASMIKLWLQMPVAMAKAVVETIKKIPGAIKEIVGVWGNLKNGVAQVWEQVKNSASSMLSTLVGAFKEAWVKIKGVFAHFTEFFGGLWAKIKSTFTDLGKSIGNAIGGAVKSGINTIITMIQNTINKAIDLINGAIKLVNKLPGVDVDNIKHLTLPKLAKGGIVNRSTIAEIGEDGREAILPLENNKGWIKELSLEISKAMLTPLTAARSNQSQTMKYTEYNDLVSAFKTALSQMKVELDDDEVGAFVEKTVTNAIYT